MVDNNLNKFGARSDAGPKCLSITAAGLSGGRCGNNCRKMWTLREKCLSLQPLLIKSKI